MTDDSGAEIAPATNTDADLAASEAEIQGDLAARRKHRFHLVPALPITILSLFVLAAVFAPLLTQYDPVRNDLVHSLESPAWLDGGSSAHLLGTDSFGRDVFTRLLYGARVSLSVALFALVIAVLVGTTVGMTAGFLGKWVDSVLMRLTDVILGLPTLLVALVIAIAVGPSFRNLVLVLGFLIWPRIARLIRGETMVVKRTDFVRYSQAIGVTKFFAVMRHVFHNILPTLLVAATLEIGSVILSEASISFLGAGVPPPEASWGVMISDGEALVSTGWWISMMPGIAIAIVVLSSNALGDWLRDHLDPKTRRI
jgi:peptide/nickel transport system permease protein